MAAYYNEIDPYAAQWLRNLIKAGHIASGDVDERSIRDVKSDDLRGYTQCHFFAGIGVWSHALRRAGWSDDVPVWTGSCPCQPFSIAGKQGGFEDDRHLWPVWFDLIKECRPAVVLGEQVASALEWIDLVSSDLEGQDYAFGASDLCAAGFDGAHIRQRLYFCASDERVDHTSSKRLEGYAWYGRSKPDRAQEAGSAAERSGLGWLANSDSRERQRVADGEGCEHDGSQAGWQQSDSELESGSITDRPCPPMLGRNPADWLFCRDGKWRPVEPGTFPMAHEIAQRVGRLRAYGNAIDAETATAFCTAARQSIMQAA